MTPAKLEASLGELLHIPPNCIRATVTLLVKQLPIVEAVCYVTDEHGTPLHTDDGGLVIRTYNYTVTP